jgi:hypothetical protein
MGTTAAQDPGEGNRLARIRRSGRTARVAMLRRQVQAGTYEPNIELLIDRIMEAMGLAPNPTSHQDTS